VRQKTVSLEAAVAMCCEETSPVGVEKIKVESSVGRICGQDIFSPVDVPGFVRSRVDGYAVTRVDLEKSAKGEDLRLQVEDAIAAGNDRDIALTPGKCVKVMTGAALPQEAAAVVKQEDVQVDSERVIVGKGISHGENMETAGSIIAEGEKIAGKGQVIGPEEIERLSSAGCVEIAAYRPPRVYIINTGSELVLPGNLLKKGEIYLSNRGLLISKLYSAGCKPLTGKGAVEDDIAVISAAIEEGLELSDMVIVSGGSSYGDYDMVLSVLENINADLLFTGIEIRPGSTSKAAVKNGRLIINLPGNPRGGELLFDVLLLPIINRLKGLKEYENRWFDIKLGRPVPGTAASRILCQAELVEEDAVLAARPLFKKEPFTGIKKMVLDIKKRQGNKGDIVKGMIL